MMGNVFFGNESVISFLIGFKAPKLNKRISLFNHCSTKRIFSMDNASIVKQLKYT
jgi:hypothetical protein